MFKLLPIIALLTLAGCSAGFDDEFGCSAVDGLDGCPTMNDIHSLIDSGAYATDHNGVVIGRKEASETAQQKSQAQPIAINAPLNSGEPPRYKEVVKEIIIYPYQDHQGNYYDTTIVHTVLKSSHWLIKPPNAIIHSQYE